MKPDNNIHINIKLLDKFVSETQLKELQPRIDDARKSLFEKTCAGNEYLGWLDLPTKIEPELERINQTAKNIRSNADHLICIGIGGSYLGTRAAIDFLADPIVKNDRILYFGHQIGSDYAASLFDYIKQKDVYVNVISKSGTTTEPAIAFRLLREALSAKYSPEELRTRIIATTSPDSGIIREIATTEGYETFILANDIGGRFSVLSPVGLLPIAVAGFDIEKLVAGAQDMAEHCQSDFDVLSNTALTYAAARHLLWKAGKSVEVFSSFEPSSQYLAEWWKQLYGESEGKDEKGIYPTSALLTTDLHSLGQFLQEGTRILFETFLTLRETKQNVTIPHVDGDSDQLNFLAGDTLKHINEQAYVGTKFAHYEGGLPNMTIQANRRDEYTLGQLFYFFEFSVAISGLLMGINPFNQPGVEAYKKNMFALLNKPGYENRRKALEKMIKGA